MNKFSRELMLIVSSLFVIFTPSLSSAYNPSAPDFEKNHFRELRIMSYNMERKFLEGTIEELDSFDRILSLLSPDVILFQEIVKDTSVSDLQGRLDDLFGGEWHVNAGTTDGFNRNAVASRYPFLRDGDDSIPGSELRRITWAEIDLPESIYNTNAFVMSVHFKAGGSASDQNRRQLTADAAANWIADLTTPGGEITLDHNTPIIFAGDVNLNDSRSQQPWETILTGDIQDNTTYGSDRVGDWDSTFLNDAMPRDPYDLDMETHPSGSTNPSNRFDRIAYTDSVATLSQSFVFNLESFSDAGLLSLGLNRNDAEASDHLPIVADFQLGGISVPVPSRGDLFVTEIMPNPTLVSDSNGEWFEVYNASEASIDLNGWLINSEGTVNLHLINSPIPITVPAAQYRVLSRISDMGINGGVPAEYAYGTGLFLGNTSDTLELWRGSVKVDGIRYANGGVGEGIPNAFWANSVPTGASLYMMGDLQNGPTGQIGISEILYNAQDFGTPGGPNDGNQNQQVTDGWLFF